MLKNGLFILFVLLITNFAFAQKPDPNFTDKIALEESGYFKLKSTFTESVNYSLSDLVYQRMEWQINPSVKYIKGSVTSYFKSLTQNLTEIEFDLNSLMTVDSVLQDKQKISFTHNNNKLVAQLNKPLQNNQLDSVKVFYQGEPEKELNGFGSFVQSEHQGTPIIWTLSEPYGAMEWWPCKQSLNDKIDSIDVIVTCPENYRTASNGLLISETENDGFRTMHWKHRHPITTYLVAIAVTNYAEYSDSLELEDGRILEILNYVFPENLNQSREETPVTADLIKLFNGLFGEYPFANEKYGHAQFGWGGGMEHQTMSFMANFSFHLISHELAHQWFGDYITCGSWQDIWLNEGFATYLTGLSYETFFEGEYWPTWKKQQVDRIIRQPDGSVYVKDTTDIGAIFSGRLSYSKGAYLLHMLRWILGEDDFFKGMRAYYNDPEIANGFARNHQFVEHMETAGDTSLTEFFNDWYYGEGFPLYSVQYSTINDGKLKVIVSQSTSHKSVDFFEMPVPIRVYNLDKTDSMDFRLNHTTNNQEFILDVSFGVNELVVDPELWLVSKTNEIVSVKTLQSNNNLNIYPNPFTEKINIDINDNSEIKLIQLFSSKGKLISQYSGTNTISNFSELSSGTYILHIQTSTTIYKEKIVKQ